MARLLHIAVFVLLGVIFLALGIGDAFAADRRVALVIGNSKYKDTNIALTNPGSDAEDIAAMLRKLEFTVIVARDATTREMDAALKKFGEEAKSADTALFFYAGHALQYQGNNFLMPIDALLEEEVDLRRSMVSDEQVRSALDRSSGVKIMILDACRNNPYADRFKRSVLGQFRALESTRGLARIDKTQGTIVAYAASPGDVASDGDTRSRNSPYTAALLKWLQEPAVEITTMFRKVTNDVWDETRGKQQPEFTTTLRNDYYLDPLADKRIWEELRSSGNASRIRDFIKNFPNSVHVFEAQNRLRLIIEGQVEREQQALKEKQQLEAERARQEVCRREGDEFASMRDDLAGLQATLRRWSCPQVVADANARISAMTAQREAAAKAEEARRVEEQKRLAAERCRNEQAQVEALGNDLAKLQEFTRQAGCDAARTFANDRIKTVTAQRQTEERQRAEAERICRTEQQQMDAIWNDQTRLQAFVARATCEQVRTTASERIKTVVAAQREADERKRAEAERICRTERQQMEARWNDVGQLRELQRSPQCQEIKPSLNARISALEEAQKQELARQQQAAFTLAALEEEQNNLRRQEEQRLRAEREREQAALRCKSETDELASIETDLAKLREFAKRIGCEDVRAITRAKIVTLEKEEKACKTEADRRDYLLRQVKGNDRAKLADYKQQATKFEQEMSCERLRASVAEMIGTIRVKIAQVDLKRLTCYKGDTDGVLNDATRDAVKLFLTKIARPDKGGEVDEDLLARLTDRSNAAVCKPEPQERPAVADRPPPREEPRKPAVAPRRPEPPRQASAPSRPAPVARPAPAAPSRPAVPSGGASVIGLH